MRKFLCTGWLSAALIAALVIGTGCTPGTPASEAATGAATGSTAGAAAETVTLNVFAAASLTEAFREIGAQVSADNPGVEVVFNFAGSNQLATQIGQGAPADVFASANKTQMNAAIDSGRIVSGTQQTFARNRLVVVTPGDNPAGITALADLGKPGVKLVLAAKEVPVGQYVLDFLDKAAADETFGTAYRDAVLANVVSYEENVRGVLTKVALGEADAGIVYSSDVAASGEGEVGQIDIPDALNTIAMYPIAVLGDSAHPELAQAFVDAVLSADGQGVLRKYGFLSAGE